MEKNTISPIKKHLIKIPFLLSFYLFLKKSLFFLGYIRDIIKYEKGRTDQRFPVHLNMLQPFLLDKTSQTKFEPHYTYHPAWAARIIAEIKPKKHIDISSFLPFSTLLSAFIPVEFYDYRPANIFLSNLVSKRGDLMNLPFADNSVETLSCMHTIEHIGLGRYGDPIDPEGDLKAIKELRRVTRPGGTLIFVVPVGKQRLIFNAHRIYSFKQIISYFPDMTLKEFSLIPDVYQQTGIIRNATQEDADKQNWGCGCFWWIKK